jgi:hypothetical protein
MVASLAPPVERFSYFIYAKQCEHRKIKRGQGPSLSVEAVRRMRTSLCKDNEAALYVNFMSEEK